MPPKVNEIGIKSKVLENRTPLPSVDILVPKTLKK